MSDLFALQLIQSISTVVDGNTSVLDSDSVDATDRCSVSEDVLQSSSLGELTTVGLEKLKMFDSQFVKRLVTWLRLTMEAHVNAGKETAPDEMVVYNLLLQLFAQSLMLIYHAGELGEACTGRERSKGAQRRAAELPSHSAKAPKRPPGRQNRGGASRGSSSPGADRRHEHPARRLRGQGR